MKNNNNLLGKIVSTAKNLWSKLDDPMTPSSTKTENEIIIKQDNLEEAVSDVKSTLSPPVPVTDKAKDLRHEFDNPMPIPKKKKTRLYVNYVTTNPKQHKRSFPACPIAAI